MFRTSKCSSSGRFVHAVLRYFIMYLYRATHKLRSLLRESVPYVKLYRYNPKHLYPKLNGYGDNGRRSLKLWQLLLTYWLPNTYWNWQEYVVYVMLIFVLYTKVTCECHKAIKLNTKILSHYCRMSLGFQVFYADRSWCYLVTSELPCAECSAQLCHVAGHAQWTSMASRRVYITWTP
jgi:hypothetical protein